MKVLILTLGTRGDVQPFVALAKRLLCSGHDVVVAAPSRFAGFVGGHNVSFGALDDGPLRLMDTGSVVGDVSRGGLGARVALARQMPRMFTEVLRDCWSVASTGIGADPDVVVHNGQVVAGQHVAEKLGVPAVLALPLPMYVPTGEFAWPGMALPAGMPAALNRLSFLGMKGPALAFGRTVDAWRASLGLRRRRGRHDPLRRPDGGPVPVLHAVSRHVVPRPADWPAWATTTGYWFLEAAQPEPMDGATTGTVDARASHSGLSGELAAFLAAGKAPVFVGFGSMAGPDPGATTSQAVEALEQVGVRAVLATGWGGLTAGRISDDILVLDEAPHDRLFPHVAAVVHHGGAGTTAAAVAAGRPQVVCPFVADQPFWARRMHALGVASEPLPQRRLTATSLAAALEVAVGDPAIADRARALGELVRAERGLNSAVERLERVGMAGSDGHA